MAMQPPPPPSITPRQMNLLRVVTAMAWADGELAAEEVDIMLDRFSRLFSVSPQQQDKLKEELRDYMMQNIPLEELIPKLTTQPERELVLQLGYEVIASSARTPDEPNINAEEAEAYQKLVSLLNLPADVVPRIEAEAEKSLQNEEGIIEKLASQLQAFLNQ
ncbi:Tellurite resistance protein TerB [Oscillatoria acuminata PCC 6304]|uniref:Tellurite resistance protein TerB n=2 Tax=Oscillatoria acuminata TaxID=118323 RepID=K9TJS6_9CYAN|nr:Tellurite resistance protein TerB [Oscillatoria acuminata PCC 6304]